MSYLALSSQPYDTAHPHNNGGPGAFFFPPSLFEVCFCFHLHSKEIGQHGYSDGWAIHHLLQTCAVYWDLNLQVLLPHTDPWEHPESLHLSLHSFLFLVSALSLCLPWKIYWCISAVSCDTVTCNGRHSEEKKMMAQGGNAHTIYSSHLFILF